MTDAIRNLRNTSLGKEIIKIQIKYKNSKLLSQAKK